MNIKNILNEELILMLEKKIYQEEKDSTFTHDNKEYSVTNY